MGTLTRKFAQVGAVLAISSLALVGCTAQGNTPENTPGASTSSEAPEVKTEATAEGAATFANEFFAALLAGDTIDYENLPEPPHQLDEAQMETLMLDGKVEGLSDEQVEELVDYFYTNIPLGDYLYFSEDATVQERLQTIFMLMLAQGAAGSVAEEQAPEKVTAEDVTLDESGEFPTASFQSTDEDMLAPALIFVDGEWKINGAAFLAAMTGGGAVDGSAETAPAE